MAERKGFRVACQKSLSTNLSPYTLIELDQQLLQAIKHGDKIKITQPQLKSSNCTTHALSSNDSFSLKLQHSSSTYCAMKTFPYTIHFPPSMKHVSQQNLSKEAEALVLHMDREVSKFQNRVPQISQIYQVMSSYKYEGDDSQGIQLNQISTITGISRRQLKEILAKQQDLVYIKNQQGRFCWVSQWKVDNAACQIFSVLKQLPITKGELTLLLEQNKKNIDENVIDLTLKKLFDLNVMNPFEVSRLNQSIVMKFSPEKYSRFLINKMRSENTSFAIQEFINVFKELGRLILNNLPSSYCDRFIEFCEVIDLQNNIIEGFTEFNLSLILGNGYFLYQNKAIHVVLIKRLLLGSNPEHRIKYLSKQKTKWFPSQITALIQDCFFGSKDMSTFIKENFNQVMMVSWFDPSRKQLMLQINNNLQN